MPENLSEPAWLSEQNTHNVEKIKDSLFISAIFYMTQKIASSRKHVPIRQEVWKLEFRLSDFLASVRFREIKHGTDWDDAGRINFRVRHVVMTLDMIEVDGVGNAGLLI